MSHRTRRPVASRFPVHVTTRLEEGLPSLRTERTYRVVRGALVAGSDRMGFRLVHFTVMSNHLHLIAEVRDRRALSRGMQGLLIRLAKALNRAWERRGSVFADRYFDRILRSPREVRVALAYVLRNATRHGMRFTGIDPFSSGWEFDGWKERSERTQFDPKPMILARARSFLLRRGWRRHGRISLAEVPGPG